MRLFLLALAVCLSALGQTTTRITDTWRVPVGGGTFSGNLRIAPSAQIVEGAVSYLSQGSYTITNGAVDIYLVPNDAVVPANTFYRATFTPTGNAPGWTEIWIVTTSATALKRIDIWQQNVSQISAIARLPLFQLSNVGASGSVIRSNGANWTSSFLGLDSLATTAKTGNGNRALTSVSTLNTGCLYMGADGNVTSTGLGCGSGAHASSHAAAGSDPVTLAISQITNLQTLLDGKASTSHDHTGVYQPLASYLTTYAGKAPPSGTVVGTSDVQTLIAKTITESIFQLNIWTQYTIGAGAGQRPANPASGTVVVVNDAVTPGNCGTGGGTSLSICVWDGATWNTLGGATGSGDLTGVSAGAGASVTNGDGPVPTVAVDTTTTPQFVTDTADASGNCSVGAIWIRTDTADTWDCTTANTWTRRQKYDANLVTAAGTLTSNAPVIGGGSKAVSVGSRSGNTTEFATVSGTKTAAKQLVFDASGNIAASVYDAGAAGGGGTLSQPTFAGTIDFGSIPDTGCAQSTFSASGLAAGTGLTLVTELAAGLFSEAWTDATDTVGLRICNLSGVAVDPASATYTVAANGVEIIRQTTAPSTCTAGSGVWQDTNDSGKLYVCSATDTWSLVAGSGTGDLTDVNAGTGISVTNSSGPAPTVAVDTSTIQARFYGAATGTDTYSVAVSGAMLDPGAYADGLRVYVKFTNANTGASTLVIGSNGAKAIRRYNDSALASGELIAGKTYLLTYCTACNSAAGAFLVEGATAIRAADVPTLNQSTTGTAANLSGTPALPNGTTATTQTAADNSTKLATTAYVDSGLSGKQATGNYATAAASGSLTTSGAYGVTLTVTGTTNVTLPTSGTLATTAGNVATASALASNPTACTSGQYVSDIAADGTLTCGTPAGGAATSYIRFPAANCQLGAASTGFTLPATLYPTAACATGTNSIFGYLSFSNNGSAAAESVQTRIDLAGTVSSIDVVGKWRTAATSGDVVWQIQTACVADAETGDPPWNTAQTITDTAKGTTLQFNDFSLTGLTLTGCSTGETLLLKFFRDATHASDSLADAAQLISLGLTINR